jgi:hypothetical protein
MCTSRILKRLSPLGCLGAAGGRADEFSTVVEMALIKSRSNQTIKSRPTDVLRLGHFIATALPDLSNRDLELLYIKIYPKPFA